MASKPHAPAKAGAKDRLRLMTEGRWLEAYPEPVRVACLRLIDDERMNPVWASGFDFGDFKEVVMSLDRILQRDVWDRKTQAARDEWSKRFNATLDAIKELMLEGPRAPADWGFPVRDTLIMHALGELLEIPSEEDTKAYFSRMQEIESALDRSGITMIHALEHYRLQQNVDAKPTQILKKPADPKADRAHFIKLLGRYTACSAQTIATVTAVVFDEEVDDRLVRRLLTGR